MRFSLQGFYDLRSWWKTLNLSREEWHLWFAWHPIKVHRDIVWVTTVRRKVTPVYSHSGTLEYRYYEYQNIWEK